MNTKTLLSERIAKEREFLEKQAIGSDEYNASANRLNALIDKQAEWEKFESESARKDKQVVDEKKDRFSKTIIDIGKFVARDVIIPVGMTFVILKFEETGSLTSALRGIVNNFVPKKMS